jgi:exodeoxyribonuclease VIII
MSNENDAYHSDVSRVSNSMLSLLKQSPRLFYNRYELGQYTEATPAMKFGSLLHCMVLEPEQVLKRYVVVPRLDMRFKESKQKFSELMDANRGKESVSAEIFQQAAIAANYVRIHPEFEPFTKTPQLIEKRIDFEVNGFACRSKLDMICPDQQVIWDVKTTQDASPGAFARSIADYGYHRQAAFYIEACQQEFGSVFRFLFIAIQKTEPFECGVYELGHDDLSRGYFEILSLLDEYRKRKISNNWEQVWSTGIVPVSLPKFYKSGMYEVDEVAA